MTMSILDPKLNESLQDKHTQVVKLLSEFDSAKNTPMQTSGKFKYSPTASAEIDIFKNRNLSELITILGFIQQKEIEYQAGAQLLKRTEIPVFSWCGYGLDKWVHDIETRVRVMFSEDKKATLLAAKKELETYFSKDYKLGNLLKSLDSIL